MATPTVQFRHGSPVMVDHTPSSAVTGGDVVVTADTPRIAHNDISANALGALAAEGGVYSVPTATGSGSAIAADTKVYWNAGSSVVTTTAGSNKVFGVTVEANTDDDSRIDVRHDPGA